MTVPRLEELARLVEARAGEATPSARLQAAIAVSRELSDLSDDLIGRFVAEARAAELPWTEIGRLFGTSKQAAQQRYGTPGAAAEHGPPDRATTARAVLGRAADAARALGHGHIGTEHALLVLARGDGDIAADVLRGLGVAPDRILAASCMQPEDHASGPPCVMPRLKQALEHSRRTAEGLGAEHAATEHVLAGIVAVGDSMAVEILRRAGVEPDDVVAALAARLDVEPQRLRPARRRRRVARFTAGRTPASRSRR